MPIVVFIGPKGPSAWQFRTVKGVRAASCLNDNFQVTDTQGTSASLVAALQAIAAHTVTLSGAPTLVAPIPW